MMSSSVPPSMDDPDSQELLSLQLKDKKKKPKKKVDISTLDAEIEKLAHEGSSVPNEETSSKPVSQEKDQSAVGLGIDDELGLTDKKKKKRRKIQLPDDSSVNTETKREDTYVPPTTASPTIDPSLEPIQDASQSTIDYELPLKKKKRKQDIVFEGFEVISEVVADVHLLDNDNTDTVDIESMNISPWGGSDRDYSYEELLDRVFNIMKQKNPGMVERKTRLVMKPPQVMRVGARRTTFANFTDICKLLHRQPKHVFAFLLAELGTSGSIDGNNQLIIKGRFQQKQIETVLKRYIKEYVTCHTCRSPETILQRENRLFFLQCETCGSRCSVQSVKSGFQAVTNRAQMRSRQT